MNEPSDKNIDPCGRRTREMFSTRVQYALQLLGDLHVIGCCNLDWLVEQYTKELAFERRLVKMVVARLALLGILSYEPSLWGEDLYLTVSPEMISMYALVSAVDRRIDFNDPDAGEMPCLDNTLKGISVQHLIDAGFMIRSSTIRQNASGRIRLALERERKVAADDFMPMHHVDYVTILAAKTLLNILKSRRISRFEEGVMQLQITEIDINRIEKA